jgi:two-component system response regulator (stage 0 sporulation protein F)
VVKKGSLVTVKQLLIVDDQQGIRLLLNEVFKREGYETFLAANGIEALDIAERIKPDGVLLDMKIPGMDGIEILKRLKSKMPEVPVVMMTAYGELDLIQEAMKLGAAHYFTKPFDIYEVRDAVNAMLQD